jgi:hypothetical protein
MSKKKKNKTKRKSTRKTKPVPTHLQEAAEDRTAVAANVAWMLSLMSTLTAETLGLVCRWYTILVEPVDLLTVLSTVMLFVAVVSGIVTLIMTPIVLRSARTRPPSVIVRVAIFAGGLPLVVVVFQYFMQS